MKARKIKTDLITLNYGTISTPVGIIGITGRMDSITEISFGGPVQLDKMVYVLKKEKTPAIDSVIRYIDNFFHAPEKIRSMEVLLVRPKGTGKQKNTGSASRNRILLDVSQFTEKEIAVYSALLRIKPGYTVSYLKLAEKAGLKRASRFVGNAMAKNRFPIIIPCHRVVKSDGDIGNYGGGRNIKEFLLRHESSFTRGR